MQKTTTLLLSLLFITLLGCDQKKTSQTPVEATQEASDKIKVLNVATFHFGYTTDANKVDFDEEDRKTQEEIRTLSKMLAEFKPTIICIENHPQYDAEINQVYQKYLNDPSQLNTNYGERSMVAFDVARLNNVAQLYGIDSYMDYNYLIGEQIINTIDSATYRDYMNNPFKDSPELAELDKNFDKLPLLEKLRFYNHPKVLDFNININADNLLYVGTEDGFEGADEAAKFYQRNLRIYSNLNRIPMTKDDRVFILMGAAHASFLRELLERSPKFEMVNTLDYLK
ncbi:hypothetical protein EV198_0396 [Roseivirga ehrenbergii]|uniref:Uncharacterized protein n=1 Tax=Roseivirga ehrenbergii (strain DSM 102268 / JCM 13514 / KCTC 12282 / NCIMB 14502 / KMM 6017) TaxID=279360 RepID=A0A150X8T3_ROSEK|nr:DUF5694 domain-containing protein [Roseivirga ehrenbergii]KYG75141.1 hypothetical protein MB14_07720 [Roseivirga ehrenbergii]TCL13567.1 hypothetical protein EV198_0396 [Roseivirga ehrenbergii]